MSRVTEFSVPFTPDDVLDVHMRIEGGFILDFTVNYRAQFGDRWYEVVRYDAEHGAPHVHRFFLSGAQRVRALRPYRPHVRDFTPDVVRPQEDLVRNWRTYRAKMEAVVRGNA